MMANVQMGGFNLGANGVFLSSSPPNSSLSAYIFSNFRRPMSSFSSTSISPRKSCNFDGRKPKFSIVGISLVSSNSIWVKRNWCFDGRKPQFGIAGTLGNGEAEAHSASLQLIENELQFSPAFEDYLRVMELVKTDRSKNLEESVDNDSMRKRKRSIGKGAYFREGEKANSRGAKVSYREKGRDSKNGKNVNSRRSGSRWPLVVKILEKKTLGAKSRTRNSMYGEHLRKYKGDGDHLRKERRDSNMWKEQNVGEVRKVDESKTRGQPKDALKGESGDQFNDIKRVENNFQQKYVKKVNHMNDRKGMTDGNDMKQSGGEQLYTSKVEREMVEIGNRKSSANNKTVIKSLVPYSLYRRSSFTQSKTSGKEETSLILEKRKIEGEFNGNEMGTLQMDIQGESTGQRHKRFHEDNRKIEILDSKSIEVQERSTKKYIQLDDGIDVEDRAAFKTFEVLTDVRNRPRVLRMEMEERIQKLAKWLNATDVNMPEWQFSKIMHGAKIKFTEHSILRVVQILGSLGNWRRALQILQWLQSRERFKSYKSRYIYTAVLDVLGKSKRPIESLNVFHDMRKELSSYPDLAAYHCIAVTLGQAGLMKELLDVIDCMRALPGKKFKLGPLQKWDPRLEPDLVIYNAVLNACVQQKQWEGAFWVLQQLKQQNIRPTNTTYGLIMEVMLACGKYNLVHEFFSKVEKTSLPSALNYKVLVSTLWREGKIDEAVMAVKEMERRGVVGSASLYYDLARCLCSTGRCQEALLQIEKICKVAKKPLVVTYTGLIQTCLDSGSIENATYIFNEMHKFCSPNTITYNIMLKSYIKHEMFVEAKGLFQKILDGSHHIRSKYDTDQKAFPDKFTFNTMMEACAVMHNWDDFVYAYEEMLHHGFHFDVRRHLRLVLDAFRAGKKQVIETTWTHLICFGRSPPPPIIHERFCIKLQEDNHLASISCIKAYQGKDMYAFTKQAWSTLLHRNARSFKRDTFLRLTQKLRNLIDEGDCTHHLMYQNLLNACKELAEADDCYSLPGMHV